MKKLMLLIQITQRKTRFGYKKYVFEHHFTCVVLCLTYASALDIFSLMIDGDYLVLCYCQIKLGEPGWKERYYEEKFSARTPEELDAVRKDVVRYYL